MPAKRSAAAVLCQHSLSTLLDPKKERPGVRMAVLSEPQAVCDGLSIYWQRPAGVHGETCAWWTVKTVGPPYSGKLNVRWDGKGMGSVYEAASEALHRG